MEPAGYKKRGFVRISGKELKYMLFDLIIEVKMKSFSHYRLTEFLYIYYLI